MTEAEWLASDRPQALLYQLCGRLSERKLRLFAVACCRCVWDRFEDERSRQALEVAEGVAEGQIGEQLRNETWATARAVARELRNPGQYLGIDYEAACLADAAAHAVGPKLHIERAASALSFVARHNLNRMAIPLGRLPNIARDIFGNPFRPVTLDPRWQTATVTTLAQAIYADRTFEKLPILADAIEEAGCTEPAILDHCRQPGEHVRGCWAVDLLLNRN